MAGKTYFGNKQIAKIFYGTKQVKKVYYGTKLVYSAGHVVSYHINTNNIVNQEVDEGADCIANAPTVSVPGYTLQGWREDTTASSSVLSSKTCDRDGIVLYAVLKQTITLSYNGNGSTGGSTANQTGTRYYNNGNASNPSFTLRANGYSKTNYSFAKWAQGSASGTKYSPGATVSLSANTTFYAYWVATVTNYGYTGGMQSFTAPTAGIYKLEVWGAQGGRWSSDTIGGKGGYAKGNVSLAENQTIYVCVGGQGSNGGTCGASSSKTVSGGYNGGGSITLQNPYSDRSFEVGGGGGGATHIGKQNALLVSTGEANLFIVAGSGGGSWSNSALGGTGGGTNGASGANENPDFSAGGGGTQSANGSSSISGGTGGYGKGGSYSGGIPVSVGGDPACNINAGGSGYHGGGVGSYSAGGGGGSGYIGGCISGTTSMSNGVREGDGYAKITYVGS